MYFPPSSLIPFLFQLNHAYSLLLFPVSSVHPCCPAFSLFFNSNNKNNNSITTKKNTATVATAEAAAAQQQHYLSSNNDISNRYHLSSMARLKKASLVCVMYCYLTAGMACCVAVLVLRHTTVSQFRKTHELLSFTMQTPARRHSERCQLAAIT